MNNELKPLLTRLRLNGLLNTLDERLEEARQHSLSYVEFLQFIFQDEIERRDANSLQKRLQRARFEDPKTFEQFQLEQYPEKVLTMIRELQSGCFIMNKKHVIIMGPTGTGKTHLAQALGHYACRYQNTVRFIRANAFFRVMHASRADHTWQKTFHSFITPKLLIVDDFGLTKLTAQQADDFYELIAERANKGSFILTSNRAVNAWVDLFPDPVMANAALDRLANNAYQLVLEGESFRRKERPVLANIE